MTIPEFKTAILKVCDTHLVEQISFLETLMKETQDTANADSKSSMGDKYETTRAMMHLEREKQASQLSEVLKSREILHQIVPLEHQKISLGSYIETNDFNYFIAVSLGKICFQQTDIIVMSAQAPLAKLFLGKKRGEEIIFNGKKFKINVVK